MVFMGILMFTGKMNAVTGYLSTIPSPTVTESRETPQPETATEASEEEPISEEESALEEESASEPGNTDESDEANQPLPAVDFTLTDQYGNTHSLSDYKGKTIFLNFWATWCPPCRAEMPDIQKIYETADTEGDNALVVLGVAAPNYGNEKDEEGIKQFLKDNGYTYPVLMDTNADLFESYGVFSYPTTFMIDKDGNVFGYASGQLSEDTMRSIIEQTMKGQRK